MTLLLLRLPPVQWGSTKRKRRQTALLQLMATTTLLTLQLQLQMPRQGRHRGDGLHASQAFHRNDLRAQRTARTRPLPVRLLQRRRQWSRRELRWTGRGKGTRRLPLVAAQGVVGPAAASFDPAPLLLRNRHGPA